MTEQRVERKEGMMGENIWEWKLRNADKKKRTTEREEMLEEERKEKGKSDRKRAQERHKNVAE